MDIKKLSMADLKALYDFASLPNKNCNFSRSAGEPIVFPGVYNENMAEMAVQEFDRRFKLIMNHKPSKSYKVKGSLEQRKEKFKEDLRPYTTKHGGAYEGEMMNDFYAHWSFVKPGGSQMAFEKEKSFVIELRLKTWHRNNSNNTKSKEGEKTTVSSWGKKH